MAEIRRLAGLAGRRNIWELLVQGTAPQELSLSLLPARETKARATGARGAKASSWQDLIVTR